MYFTPCFGNSVSTSCRRKVPSHLGNGPITTTLDVGERRRIRSIVSVRARTVPSFVGAVLDAPTIQVRTMT